MANVPNNLALIGMPGAGKSTLGVLLAKRTARSFLDSDLLIQQAEGTSLQEIIEQRGIEVFRHIEERVVLEIDCSDAVIATGGSVVYSEIAMEHLGRLGKRSAVSFEVPGKIWTACSRSVAPSTNAGRTFAWTAGASSTMAS